MQWSVRESYAPWSHNNMTSARPRSIISQYPWWNEPRECKDKQLYVKTNFEKHYLAIVRNNFYFYFEMNIVVNLKSPGNRKKNIQTVEYNVSEQ